MTITWTSPISHYIVMMTIVIMITLVVVQSRLGSKLVSIFRSGILQGSLCGQPRQPRLLTLHEALKKWLLSHYYFNIMWKQNIEINWNNNKFNKANITSCSNNCAFIIYNNRRQQLLTNEVERGGRNLSWYSDKLLWLEWWGWWWWLLRGWWWWRWSSLAWSSWFNTSWWNDKFVLQFLTRILWTLNESSITFCEYCVNI